MNEKIYIVLVNYKNYIDTIECLESLYRINYPNYQIVIVDNNSGDGSVDHIISWAKGDILPETIFKGEICHYVNKPIEYLTFDRKDIERFDIKIDERGFYNPLVIIKSDFNGGFAFGNNIALKYALRKGDFSYVLLLNNDTIVKDDFLINMVNASSYKNVGLTGCKIYYAHNRSKIWFNSGYFNDWTGRIKHKKKEVNTKESISDFVTGCCMLIKREVLEKVGLFDETYFMYVEDVDYSYRVRQAGYLLNIAHNAIIWHKVGGSQSKELSYFAIYRVMKNTYKLFENLIRVKKISSSICYTLSKILFIIRCFLKGKNYAAKLHLRAMWNLFKFFNT